MKVKKIRIRSPKGSSLTSVAYCDKHSNDYDNKDVWMSPQDFFDGDFVRYERLTNHPSKMMKDYGEMAGGIYSDSGFYILKINDQGDKILINIDAQHRLYRNGNDLEHLLNGNCNGLVLEDGSGISFPNIDIGLSISWGSSITISSTGTTIGEEMKWEIDSINTGTFEVGKDYMFSYGTAIAHMWQLLGDTYTTIEGLEYTDLDSETNTTIETIGLSESLFPLNETYMREMMQAPFFTKIKISLEFQYSDGTKERFDAQPMNGDTGSVFDVWYTKIKPSKPYVKMFMYMIVDNQSISSNGMSSLATTDNFLSSIEYEIAYFAIHEYIATESKLKTDFRLSFALNKSLISMGTKNDAESYDFISNPGIEKTDIKVFVDDIQFTTKLNFEETVNDSNTPITINPDKTFDFTGITNTKVDTMLDTNYLFKYSSGAESNSGRDITFTKDGAVNTVAKGDVFMPMVLGFTKLVLNKSNLNSMSKLGNSSLKYKIGSGEFLTQEELYATSFLLIPFSQIKKVIPSLNSEGEFMTEGGTYSIEGVMIEGGTYSIEGYEAVDMTPRFGLLPSQEFLFEQGMTLDRHHIIAIDYRHFLDDREPELPFILQFIEKSDENITCYLMHTIDPSTILELSDTFGSIANINGKEVMHIDVDAISSNLTIQLESRALYDPIFDDTKDVQIEYDAPLADWENTEVDCIQLLVDLDQYTESYGSPNVSLSVAVTADEKDWLTIIDSELGMLADVEFENISNKFAYSIVDVSEVKLNESVPESDIIKGRYIKISLPQNNLYSRNKTTGVLTPENKTELFIRGLDVIDTDNIGYSILNTGNATKNGATISALDLRNSLMSLLKDVRSDIKIFSDLIIDLGSEKNIANVNLVLGKYDNTLKYESAYTISVSSDNITYKTLYTSNPQGITPEQYLSMKNRLIKLPKQLDTRSLPVDQNDPYAGY